GQLAFFFETSGEPARSAPLFPGRVVFASEAGEETPPPADIGPLYGHNVGFHFQYVSDHFAGPTQFLHTPIHFHPVDIGYNSARAVSDWVAARGEPKLREALHAPFARKAQPWLGLGAHLWASGVSTKIAKAQSFITYLTKTLEDSKAKLSSPTAYVRERAEADIKRTEGRLPWERERALAIKAPVQAAVDWAFGLAEDYVLTEADLERMRAFEADLREANGGSISNGGYVSMDQKIALDTVFVLLSRGREDLVPNPYFEALNASLFETGGSDGHHQIGGEGWDVQGAPERHAEDVMLMQFASDRTMRWLWGDVGVVQVWLSPEDLVAGRWENATFTFE
ncbi:MAG: DUF1963 domain-containing protein, partial [Pseudomonadota bacterium]